MIVEGELDGVDRPAKEQQEASTAARLLRTQLEGERARIKYVNDGERELVAGAVPSLASKYESLLKEYEDKVNAETLEQIANAKDTEAKNERKEFARPNRF